MKTAGQCIKKADEILAQADTFAISSEARRNAIEAAAGYQRQALLIMTAEEHEARRDPLLNVDGSPYVGPA